jgi:thioesterase domain-containing protein
LAQHLGDDQPLYGLQPPGLDGHSKPLRRIEDLAAYFAGQIRAFRPTGPCVITGFCTGGTIAFELARQLLRERVAVSFVALFGAPYPTWYRLLPQLRWHLGDQVELVVKHARALTSLSLGEWRPYIAERRRNREALRAAERTTEPDAVLVLRAGVERATIAAARRYTPGHFAGRVGLFLPCRAWARLGIGPLRWRSVARDTEEYFGPDGCTSDNMLREPYAATFAEFLRQCCARV